MENAATKKNYLSRRLKQGLREALQNDERFPDGEDAIRRRFAVSKGFRRVWRRTHHGHPLSEAGFVGAGIGAAIG
jgi:pyruvate/2-oxoglutarate/acetoin dehydrogenase E1 component